MSDLDEKLRKVISHIAPADNQQHRDRTSDAIAQIKQAFADEGYGHNLYINKVGKWQPMSGMMTGQEWYDRYQKELEQIQQDTLNDEIKELKKQWPKEPIYRLAVRLSVGKMEEAVRRAAGVDDAKA